ncbi:mechanosensitive ion channel protein [Adhaeribacter aerolatus]|uniref:Mechanosensitive ion channel protein n=1 Tax=Adhaeribacter aerolatus TaxID=670289 RepID=A0A512B202_9BACT|nr:mechanosensitive ion channel family protein [Adhaeribacter aerolatus]GEO05969.1 mechanosensitive ion channel protein [Adhaeribacter aerolatus]
MMLEINKAFSLLYNKLELWVRHLILMLPNLVIALVMLVLTFVAARIIQKTTEKLLPRFSHSVALNNLVSSLVYTASILIGIFFVLSILQLDKTVTSLLAGVGIIGLALGLAFQDIATNFISGVIIAVRKPFGVGDVVESNDYFGTIERVNLRTIDIRRVTGELVKVPNRKVFENVMVIYTHYGIRRVDVKGSVSYAEDLERVQQLVKAAVVNIKGMVEHKDVEMVYEEFGESSVNFLVRFWIHYSRQFDYVSARSEAIIKIKKAFDENNVQIPFPIRTLDFAIKGGEKLREQLKVLKEEGNENGQNNRDNNKI